jgi:AcrR family transcriptional regulator
MSERRRVGRAAYARALVELAFASDYAAVTVEEIVAEAGGSSEEFEALFASKQACAVAATEEITTRNLEIIRRAYASEERWPDSLRAGAYAMAKYIAGMLDMVWAGELTSALRDQFFAEFVAFVDAGRAVAPDPDAVPPLAAESVIGSITQAIGRYSLERGRERDPVAAVPEMMYLAVRPYLGEEEARKELTIAPPRD